MTVHDVFPSRSTSSLTSIVSQILELELKLSRLEDQTVYFRWAETNHRIHLATLRRQYNNFRLRLNEHSVEDFRVELNECGEILGRVKSSLAAGIIRGIAMSALQYKVAEIEGMIVLKGIVSELPALDELRMMPEVLVRIIEAL